MDERSYKGYVIRAVPYQLAGSNEWTVKIVIDKHRDDGVSSRPFSAGNTFKTREDAIQHCFAFGQQIIDGKAVNFSVEDL